MSPPKCQTQSLRVFVMSSTIPLPLPSLHHASFKFGWRIYSGRRTVVYPVDSATDRILSPCRPITVWTNAPLRNRRKFVGAAGRQLDFDRTTDQARLAYSLQRLHRLRQGKLLIDTRSRHTMGMALKGKALLRHR